MKTAKWCDSFGGNRGSRAMCESRFEGWDPDQFAKELTMDTFRAVYGPWRLTVWPTPTDLIAKMS
eukprot:909268-Heterocapsa_arctica.AAC.1